jgi:hypothetical protein
MTATASRTEDTGQRLQDRLAEAEQELDSAQRDLGAVELDGGDGQAASTRLAEAREAVNRLQSAQAAFEEREVQRLERERQAAEAVARWRVCCWWREYARRAAPVIELRARLEAVEQELMGLASIASAAGKGHSETRAWLAAEGQNGRLSLEAVNRLPDLASDGGQFAPPGGLLEPRGQTAGLTVDECEAWIERLDAEVAKAASEIDPDRLAREPLPWADQDTIASPGDAVDPRGIYAA